MKGSSIIRGVMKNVCSKFIDQSKQAKMAWLRDACQINGGSLNNVRSETIRHFRKKRGVSCILS
jgi:hypothetical protein